MEKVEVHSANNYLLGQSWRVSWSKWSRVSFADSNKRPSFVP